jgi:hypothetical protein
MRIVVQEQTKARKKMLRITVQEDPQSVAIKLEGKVAGSWVGEFERTWHSLEPSWSSKKFSLDLRGVSFLDGEGRGLIRKIYEKTGTAFLTNSPLTTYFAEEAMQASPKNGHQGA